jgi:predicted extracellular nuclease
MGRSVPVVVRRALVVIGFAALVAGCSQNTTTTTTTTVPTTTTTTSTTLAPTTSTTSTSSTTTTSTQTASTPCTASQLNVVPSEGTGAAGSIFSPVNVLNISTTACTLAGRPGITLIGALQGAKSAPLRTSVLTTGQGSVFGIAPTTLTLSPGGPADVGFMVESSDVPSNGEQTCPVVSSMQVTLPGIAQSFTVAETFTACGGPTISVSAIVPESALQSS